MLESTQHFLVDTTIKHGTVRHGRISCSNTHTIVFTAISQVNQVSRLPTYINISSVPNLCILLKQAKTLQVLLGTLALSYQTFLDRDVCIIPLISIIIKYLIQSGSSLCFTFQTISIYLSNHLFQQL